MNNFDQLAAQGNPQVINQLGTSGIGNTTHAVMYLVEPKFIPDQSRRAHIYTFGGEFKNELNDTMMQAQQSGCDTNLTVANMMRSMKSLSSSILPNFQGSKVNLQYFSDCWTFILIIDKGTSLSPLGTFISTIPQRILYSGWIVGEPACKNQYGQWVFNEQAVMVVTHNTTLTIGDIVGPAGRRVKEVNVTGDFDYINKDILAVTQPTTTNGTTELMYDMQPAAIANGTIVDRSNPLGDTFSVSPQSLNEKVSASNASVAIPSELNSPAHHVRKVIGGIIDGTESLKSQYRSDVFSDVDSVLGTIGGMMGVGRNINLDGLDPSQPFTMSSLMRKFGEAMNITVVHNQKTPQYELADPNVSSKRNLISAIISGTMPPLLAEYGIAEVLFRYNSTLRDTNNSDNIFRSQDDMGVFYLNNIFSLYPLTQDAIKVAWQRISRYLKDIVFPMILQTAGHFDLTVHCSLSGSTLVMVNLYDHVQENGVIETNNLLGGLNSPLIGTGQEFNANAGQLFGVVKDVVMPQATGVTSLADMGPVGIMTNPVIATQPYAQPAAPANPAIDVDDYANKLASMF